MKHCWFLWRIISLVLIGTKMTVKWKIKASGCQQKFGNSGNIKDFLRCNYLGPEYSSQKSQDQTTL